MNQLNEYEIFLHKQITDKLQTLHEETINDKPKVIKKRKISFSSVDESESESKSKSKSIGNYPPIVSRNKNGNNMNRRSIRVVIDPFKANKWITNNNKNKKIGQITPLTPMTPMSFSDVKLISKQTVCGTKRISFSEFGNNEDSDSDENNPFGVISPPPKIISNGINKNKVKRISFSEQLSDSEINEISIKVTNVKKKRMSFTENSNCSSSDDDEE